MGFKFRPVPLAIAYGRTDSVKNSGGVLINAYAERAPDDAKNHVTIVGAPGQFALATLDIAPNIGPVADALVLNERPYFVTTKGLYKITDAAGTVRKLGALSVNAAAQMATNGLDIVIVDGVKSWRYTVQANEDTVTPPAPVDYTASSDLFPSATVTSVDGYFVFERLAIGQFFHTELNSTVVDPLSVSTAEAYPDRALAVHSHRRNLFVFGVDSVEPFYNAGGVASAFSRIDGATMGSGIASPMAVASNEFGMAWLSSNGVVYITDGLAPTPISTAAIHDGLAGLNLATAQMIAYVHRGHPFFQLSVETRTFVYDVTTKLWHGLRDETYGRHRATCVVRAFNMNLMGDAAGPNIRILASNVYTNAGQPLVLDIISPAYHADQRVNRHAAFELEMDVGEGGEPGDTMGQVDLIDFDAFELIDLDGDVLTIDGLTPNVPTMLLLYSDDDGRTWYEHGEEPLGYDGEFSERVQFRGLGASRTRRYRMQISANVRRNFVSRAWLALK